MQVPQVQVLSAQATPTVAAALAAATFPALATAAFALAASVAPVAAPTVSFAAAALAAASKRANVPDHAAGGCAAPALHAPLLPLPHAPFGLRVL